MLKRIMAKTTNYIIVYTVQTDGDPQICVDTPDNLQTLIKDLKLSYYDYAIFSGNIVKSFHSRIDLKRLK